MNNLPEILETAEAERQATGFVFTEGPLWHPDGYYYFNDINPGALYRLKLGGKAEQVRKTEGGNGMTFDLEGRLIHCEGDGYRVTRTGHDGRVTTLADKFDGGRLNRPNDVVCHSDGSLWFTDPSGRRPFSERQIPGAKGVKGVWAGASVYRVATDGSIASVADFEYPNGLAFSPDERTLYVSNWDEKRKIVMRWDVQPDGSLANGRTFADMTAAPGEEALDGLKIDRAGNVFVSGPGGLWIWAPDGTHLGTIRLPELAANMAWGDADGKALYLAARTGLYRVRLANAGIRPPVPPTVTQ